MVHGPRAKPALDPEPGIGLLGDGDRPPESWACPSLWPVAHYPRRMWAGDAQGTRKVVMWEAPGMVPQGSASGQVPSPL